MADRIGAARTPVSGIEGAGIEGAGIEVAGIEAAGIEVAGIEAAGLEADPIEASQTVADEAPPPSPDAEFGRFVDAPPSPQASDTAAGFVDIVTHERASGWARDDAAPDCRVALEIFDNGTPIGRVLADVHRADLAAIGVGDGCHGFEFLLPGALDGTIPHSISIRRESDGRELEGSPVLLEPTVGFSPPLLRSVAAAVDETETSAEIERALDFIVGQADRLLQRKAARDGISPLRLAHARFLRRWKPGTAEPDAETRGSRALFVAPNVPGRQDLDGAALIALMRALREQSYAVSFAAHDELARNTPSSELLEAAGITTCHAPFYASVEEVLRRQPGGFDVICLVGHEAASRYAALARAALPAARIVYAVEWLAHKRMSGLAAARTRLAELGAAFLADAVLVRSSVDAATIRHAVPEARIHLMPVEERGAIAALLAAIEDTPVATAQAAE